MKIATIFFFSLLSVPGATSAALGSIQYIVTDLGAPAGSVSSSANGINNSGEIVGSYEDSSFVFHALFWQSSASPSVSLPALGAIDTQAQSINDAGSICGSYHSTQDFGCVWTNVTHTPTTLVSPTGSPLYNCGGINNSGQLVGSFQDSATPYHFHGCYWSGSSSVPIKLSDFPSAAQVFASTINSAGQIVGDFQDSTSAYQACMWASSSAAPSTLAILAGTKASIALGINSRGQIVGGFSTTSANLNGEHACIWNGDSVTDLNTLISPASGWMLTEADGINDSGWIVGRGTSNGVVHALLLTPIPSAPTLDVVGKKKRTVHHSSLVIHGTASGAVTSITCQIGKKTHLAQGTTSWKFTAKLKSGKNKILITSHGPGGSSPSIRITVTRA